MNAAQSQLADRAAYLIGVGETLLKGIKTVEKVRERPNLLGRGGTYIHTSETGDSQGFLKWRTQCVTLLDNYKEASPRHAKLCDEAAQYGFGSATIVWLLAQLEAFRGDLNAGMFATLKSRVEAGIVQALLEEALTSFDGIAPTDLQAGLSGTIACAVLEHVIRTLCESATPAIPTKDVGGKPTPVTLLADKLATSGVIEKSERDQLHGWLKQRNKVAHGDLKSISTDEVKIMVATIKLLVNKYMG